LTRQSTLTPMPGVTSGPFIQQHQPTQQQQQQQSPQPMHMRTVTNAQIPPNSPPVVPRNVIGPACAVVIATCVCMCVIVVCACVQIWTRAEISIQTSRCRIAPSCRAARVGSQQQRQGQVSEHDGRRQCAEWCQACLRTVVAAECVLMCMRARVIACMQ
jgi:hypothetical protein